MKYKSVIIWGLIALLIPFLLPNLLASEIILMFANEMFSGDIFLQFGVIFFIY